MWHDHTFSQRNKATKTVGERGIGKKKRNGGRGGEYREVRYHLPTMIFHRTSLDDLTKNL